MGAFCLAVLSLVVSAMIQQSGIMVPWLLSMAKQSNTVIVQASTLCPVLRTMRWGCFKTFHLTFDHSSLYGLHYLDT
jgi:hypothetical protein